MQIKLPLKIQKDLSYKIITGNNTFKDLSELIEKKLKPDKCFVITDENVFEIYQQKISKELIKKNKNYHLFVIPPGEKSKSQKTRDELENLIINYKPSRNSLIVAFGGGIVGDLSGFLASTILRGIRYIQVPTTIISQVDSAIGGKTGINTKHSKNLIGTFHQPELVLVDFNFIQTLPDDEFFNGVGEILKSLLIGSEEGFRFLEINVDKIFTRDEEILKRLIEESIKVKVDIVAKDPEEKNLRKILNFGHTIGHAIESLSNYKIKHGFAVAEGIVVESYLSFLANRMSEVDLLRIQYIVDKLNLDKKQRGKLEFQKVYEKMSFDKKKINDQITFSLLRKIGMCNYNKIVDKELVEVAYHHSL
jgi:3-dehydroquinate synthase